MSSKPLATPNSLTEHKNIPGGKFYFKDSKVLIALSNNAYLLTTTGKTMIGYMKVDYTDGNPYLDSNQSVHLPTTSLMRFFQILLTIKEKIETSDFEYYEAKVCKIKNCQDFVIQYTDLLNEEENEEPQIRLAVKWYFDKDRNYKRRIVNLNVSNPLTLLTHPKGYVYIKDRGVFLDQNDITKIMTKGYDIIEKSSFNLPVTENDSEFLETFNNHLQGNDREFILRELFVENGSTLKDLTLEKIISILYTSLSSFEQLHPMKKKDWTTTNLQTVVFNCYNQILCRFYLSLLLDKSRSVH